MSKFTSFSDYEKSVYWINELNNTSPDKVGYSSKKKYWFICPDCDHKFQKSIISITTKNSWCTFCAGIELCGKKECGSCFDHSFASHPKCLHWSEENELKPIQVPRTTDIKYVIKCDKCPHIFMASPCRINIGEWCPYCANKKRCMSEDCTYCIDNSFASHEKAKYWNKDNPITAREVAKCSNKVYYFDCNKCDHTFLSSPNIIVKLNAWCPYCAGKKVCDKNNCDDCFNKSFASNPKAEYWNYCKNPCSPRDVLKSTDKKYYFTCRDCNHDINIMLQSVNRGVWCIFCASRQLCEDAECDYCFNKSLASFPKIKQFISSASGKQPRQIFKKSSQEFCIFKCDICNNKFGIALNNLSRGGWCPKCKNKTEKILFTILTKKYPSIDAQVKFTWGLNGKGNVISYDFFIKELNLLIELDGQQHFSDVKTWNSIAENQRENDVDKMISANENGMSMIRLLQKDVLRNKNNWEEKLYQAINNVTNQKDGIVTNQYISNTDIYNNHINDLEKKVSENNVSKKKVSTKKMSNKKVSNKKVFNNKLPDKKTSDKKASDKKVSDKKVPDKKVLDKKVPDKKVPDKKVSDKKVPDEKVPDKKVSDIKAPDIKIKLTKN
jgi:very-short-patch-repair endonuclease